ncbi:hypothetical protein T4B_11653 [Trichinella pseudospiralis]|uniref:Uncharacterized protein n=1 Tax=Trichinella pseudospiralis TaxID=6337 RepID=A0A0V1J0D7_TRIPS|nr:hypothetical protein T4B_11653 [Trichinella pseudospiralis]KRZ43339.1 hypothetical protein T4C_5975 [Trichinella pseudospiralis]
MEEEELKQKEVEFWRGKELGKKKRIFKPTYAAPSNLRIMITLEMVEQIHSRPNNVEALQPLVKSRSICLMECESGLKKALDLPSG